MGSGVLLYIQKEMHRMHTETTRSSGYWLGTVLLLYLLRTDAAHHEKPQREERTPGRPLQPLLQHAAAAQQVPKEQQHEQQTDQSCSTSRDMADHGVHSSGGEISICGSVLANREWRQVRIVSFTCGCTSVSAPCPGGQ